MRPTAPPTTAAAPPRQPAQRWPARLLLERWGSSLAVAATAVGSALLLSLVLALVVKQPAMSMHDTLVLMSMLANGAFGADALVDRGAIGGGVGAIPLTVTVVVAAATVVVFRRVTARDRCGADGLVVAGRAALVAGLAMMGVALGLRATVAGATVRASAIGALVLTTLVLFVVLAIAVVTRGDWLRSRPARVAHDWARAPVIGLATMVCVLPLAGGVAGLAVLWLGSGSSGYTAGYDADQWRAIIGGAIAYAGNGGVWAVTLGSGGRVALFGIDDLQSLISRLAPVDLPTGGRLTWFTGDFHEPGLWVCVVLAPAVLAAGAYAVVRAARARRGAPGPTQPLRGLVVWGLALLGAVPVAVRCANIHLHAGVEDYGIHVAGGFGAFGLGATFLLVGYAVLVAVLVGGITGGLSRRAIRSAVAALDARLRQRGPVSQRPTAYHPPRAAHPGPTGPPPSSPPGASHD